MTFQTPIGLANGIHYYYCTVKSDYSNVVATSDLFTVTVCLPPEQPGTISGSANVCSGSSLTYSVVDVPGVTYTWEVPSGWGTISGQGSNSITVTAGSTGGNITVTPSNSCGNSGTSRTLAVSPGYIIADGAYDGPTTSNLNGDGTTMSQLTDSYDFAVSGDLCLAQADQGSLIEYTWEDAGSQCSKLGTDWRLPNIAELGNLQGSQTSYGMAQNTYWSSTDRSNNITAWFWNYLNSNAYFHNKPITFYVRCVRSL
jgi:hypothetical protein